MSAKINFAIRRKILNMFDDMASLRPQDIWEHYKNEIPKEQILEQWNLLREEGRIVVNPVWENRPKEIDYRDYIKANGVWRDNTNITKMIEENGVE